MSYQHRKVQFNRKCVTALLSWFQYLYLQMSIGLETGMCNVSRDVIIWRAVFNTDSLWTATWISKQLREGCIIHIEFYFKIRQRCTQIQKEMRGRDDSVCCSLGHCHCHSGEYYSTVRLNSWPNLSLSVTFFFSLCLFSFWKCVYGDALHMTEMIPQRKIGLSLLSINRFQLE